MAVNGFFSLFSNQRPAAGPRMHRRFGNKGLVQRIRRISKIGFNALVWSASFIARAPDSKVGAAGLDAGLSDKMRPLMENCPYMFNTNNNEKDSHYIGIILKYYPLASFHRHTS